MLRAQPSNLKSSHLSREAGWFRRKAVAAAWQRAARDQSKETFLSCMGMDSQAVCHCLKY
jgi:hypothetical protein